MAEIIDLNDYRFSVVVAPRESAGPAEIVLFTGTFRTYGPVDEPSPAPGTRRKRRKAS